MNAVRTHAALLCLAASIAGASATPANKAALEHHYDRFLPKALKDCTTCHLPSPIKNPERLADFPHNNFGARLRELSSSVGSGLPARLSATAGDDSDRDGVPNETEILLGTNPGDAGDRPSESVLKLAPEVHQDFQRFLDQPRWDPFTPVTRPSIPPVQNTAWLRNPIDAFIAAEHDKRSLRPRPEATRTTLLRRVYLDLIGLVPTPSEQQAFAGDNSPDAYEKVVDRLLEDPRYGERWGRHWMDIWRYSDWAGWSGGNQIRDSQPHIWRWRDWIIESLNEDKPYDRMIVEMLAADEIAPADPDALRATGFLARNYKMLSREQWLEDTLKHTSQAFLGLTLGCAKCHDHMTDPISQAEYYQVRAIFEPHQVRIDRVPGELDRTRDGLVRVYDVGTNRPTHLFLRGDERFPDTNQIMAPGVPGALGNHEAWSLKPVSLPRQSAEPDNREFVRRDLLAQARRELDQARRNLDNPDKSAAADSDREVLQLELELVEAKLRALEATIRFERASAKDQSEEKIAATAAQRAAALAEARLKLHGARREFAEAESSLAALESESDGDAAKARKKVTDAGKKISDIEADLAKLKDPESDFQFKPRDSATYPAQSTGRRSAFARWIASRGNPLTARVAVNHIWLRHFGAGIVRTPADFGRNGARPSHPELLDWLAAEFMGHGWGMKHLHRLIVTSAAYRMAATPDPRGLEIDPDNTYLWRSPSRRMEAELVRDNLLFVSGQLDCAFGGPEIDHQKGLVSRRRSIYLRLAAEKEVEFLKVFDGPSVNECYQRTSTVMPQQALALANSSLAIRLAGRLAQELTAETGVDDALFVQQAFKRILARPATPQERRLCASFLEGRAEPDSLRVSEITSQQSDNPGAMDRRKNLVLVLFNHNDFITTR